MQDAPLELRQSEIRELITALQRHLDDGAVPEVVRQLTDELQRRTLVERRYAELFEAEQEARAKARLYHDQNEAKDRFLAVLSHELRTPLQPVLSAASALLRDPRVPVDLLEEVRTIQRNVQLEARLIDDLLDLTRITTGKLALERSPVNINSVIARAVEICDPEAIEKRLRLSVALRAARTWVSADPGRLQQILWNLIKNAVKFTPAGGSILVRTANDPAGRLIVEVEDNGIGIEPHVLPRIFDAFEQGGDVMTHKFGGMGLGLAISKVLADLHDATLDAASAGKDQGATFTLTFATIDGPRPDAPPHSVSAHPATAGTLRILLVEDDADTARVMSRLLRTLKHDVTAASTCADAIDAIDRRPFDLLICDLGLPDGNGLDLLEDLRLRRPLKAIALTGYGTEDDIRKSSAAGFDCHLTKPITLEQLVVAINKLL